MNDENKLNARIGDLVEIDMWNDLKQGLIVDKLVAVLQYTNQITIH